MLPTTILIDETPKCVVRPTDTKALNRFIKSGKSYLLDEKPSGRITHRNAEPAELAKWQSGYALHKAWGGDDEAFFGVPL